MRVSRWFSLMERSFWKGIGISQVYRVHWCFPAKMSSVVSLILIFLEKRMLYNVVKVKYRSRISLIFAITPENRRSWFHLAYLTIETANVNREFIKATAYLFFTLQSIPFHIFWENTISILAITTLVLILSYKVPPLSFAKFLHVDLDKQQQQQEYDDCSYCPLKIFKPF
jgi:hypothetical protein